MKDKYRRRMLKPAGPPANASAASRTTGSAHRRGRGMPMGAMHAMLTAVGTGRSVRTSKPHGASTGQQGIGSTAPRSMRGGLSFGNMSPVDQKVFSMLESNHARPANWLYNGTPALCRKCGRVFDKGLLCSRDTGHACELESVASAEERRLSEVSRMLKATFNDAPQPLQSVWKQLVGLQQTYEDRN